MRWRFLIVFIVLTGCGGDKNHIPKTILPREKMRSVMWDMIRADQLLTNYVLNKDTSLNKDSTSISLYQKIFKIHNITKQEFQLSFSYYQNHPDLLKEVFDSLNARQPYTTPPTSNPSSTNPSPIRIDTANLHHRQREFRRPKPLKVS